MMKLMRGRWTALSIVLGAAISTAAGCTDDAGGDFGTSEEAVLTQCTISISAAPTTVTLGQPVNFTATASCPTGTPEIQWYQRVNSSWQVVQAYSTATTMAFDSSSSMIGVNNFYAGVRKQGAVPMEAPAASNTVSVTINDNVPSCTKVVMTAPASGSNGVAGTPINLAANPTCPGPSECQFWYKLSTTTTWTVMPAYSASCTSAFTPPSAGTWNLQAVARVQGAHVQYSARSMSVSVNVSAAPVNHPPVAVDDVATTNEHTAVTITVIANDSDPDGDPLTVSATNSAGHGTVTFSGGNVTYTPVNGFVGTDGFTYTVTDGKGGFANANVDVNVLDQNPVPVDDHYTTTVHAGVSFDPTLNDSDPDGDPLTITVVGAASNGTVTQSGNTLTYTPNAGFCCDVVDVFSYTVSDGLGGSASANVFITVSDRAPVAGNDSGSTAANQAVQIDVGANDSDPDGDALTWSYNNDASWGGVTFTGSVATYTPARNFVGSDSFTYTVTDVYGMSATATVTITVSDVAPVATDDTIVTSANQQGTVDVLQNDTSPIQDPLTLSSVTQGAHGTVTVGSGGNVFYTPNTDYVGPDTFTYVVSDNHGGSTVGHVAVTVLNLPPVAVDDNLVTNMNVQGSVNVLANDSDPDHDALTVVAVFSAQHGVVTIGTGGFVNYLPNTGYVGTDTFGYEVDDANGAGAQATVHVTVNPTTVGCTISLATTTPSVVWGNNVHFDATASCNTGPAQVQLYRRDNSTWTVVAPWGPSQSFDTIAQQVVGNVQYYAAARTQGTTTPVASSNTVTIAVADNVPSCTNVRITQPTNAFTGTVGTPITLAASATCGTATPEYEFLVKLSTATVWTTLPGYTQTTSSWTPPSAGTWNIKAAARAVGAHVPYSGVMSPSVTGTVN
jgi:hypothetical protein